MCAQVCVCASMCVRVWTQVCGSGCACGSMHIFLGALASFSVIFPSYFFSDPGSHTEPETHNPARLAGPSALSLPAYLGTEAMWNHHTQLLHGAGDLNLGPCSYAVSTLLTASSAPLFFFLSRSYCIALADLSSLCTPDWPLIYHRLACSTH